MPENIEFLTTDFRNFHKRKRSEKKIEIRNENQLLLLNWTWILLVHAVPGESLSKLASDGCCDLLQ